VTRLDPIISLLASNAVALYLRRMWVVRAVRPVWPPSSTERASSIGSSAADGTAIADQWNHLAEWIANNGGTADAIQLPARTDLLAGGRRGTTGAYATAALLADAAAQEFR